MSESGYKVIIIRPGQSNPRIRVSFVLDSRDWSKLEGSKEWKSFVGILEEYQNRENLRPQKDLRRR